MNGRLAAVAMPGVYAPIAPTPALMNIHVLIRTRRGTACASGAGGMSRRASACGALIPSALFGVHS